MSYFALFIPFAFVPFFPFCFFIGLRGAVSAVDFFIVRAWGGAVRMVWNIRKQIWVLSVK
jgi:hypothetical protein